MTCWHGYLSAVRCKYSSKWQWHPITSRFIKIQTDLIFLVPGYPDCPVCSSPEHSRTAVLYHCQSDNCNMKATEQDHQLLSIIPYWSALLLTDHFSALAQVPRWCQVIVGRATIHRLDAVSISGPYHRTTGVKAANVHNKSNIARNMHKWWRTQENLWVYRDCSEPRWASLTANCQSGWCELTRLSWQHPRSKQLYLDITTINVSHTYLCGGVNKQFFGPPYMYMWMYDIAICFIR